MFKLPVFIIVFIGICVMGSLTLFASGVPIPGTQAGWIVFCTFLSACFVAPLAATAPYNN